MTISRSKLLASLAALLALVAVAATPGLLGHRVASAFDALAGAEKNWLALGAMLFVLAFACTVGAWRAALGAAGGRIGTHRAAACIGVGSLVNAFAPAKLGDAVKIGLCARSIDAPGRIWTAGGVYAALAAARCLTLAALLVVASLTGAMPLWPVFALCGAVAILAVAAALLGPPEAAPADRTGARRVRRARTIAARHRDRARLDSRNGALASRRDDGRRRRTRPAPPRARALVVLPALDVASAFPLTPGSIGIGSGAVAVALAGRGIGMTQALGVGFAIQALETFVSIAAGTSGALYLAWPKPSVRRWTRRVATVGGAAALAAALGFAVISIT